MLVKKVFDRSRRSRRRNWKLQRMADGLDTESVEKSVYFSVLCQGVSVVSVSVFRWSVGLSALCVSLVTVGLCFVCFTGLWWFLLCVLLWSLLVSLLVCASVVSGGGLSALCVSVITVGLSVFVCFSVFP